MSLLTRWKVVKCAECGRVHCHATPGSKVRFRCKRCKVYRIVDV